MQKPLARGKKIMSPAGAWLTSEIKTSTSVERVMSLHAQCGADFNLFHLGACWGALGRMHKPCRVGRGVGAVTSARDYAPAAHGAE